MKQCGFCQKSVHRLAGHGFCAACYYRERRNGTPDYIKVRKPCTVDGCENLSVAHGLCEMHYRRKQRTGLVEADRFDRWGYASVHPLYHTWRWIKKRTPAGAVPKWDDFWAFVGDVGERPSKGHRIRRENSRLPWGPDNFFWEPPRTDVERGTLDANAAWMRAYRMSNPRLFRNIGLRKSFGIGIEEYERMLKNQDGVCAICKQEEKAINPKTGSPRSLAVDHCHTSGKVRGLLCSAHNTALGLFNDDPAALRAAAAYLERATIFPD